MMHVGMAENEVLTARVVRGRHAPKYTVLCGRPGCMRELLSYTQDETGAWRRAVTAKGQPHSDNAWRCKTCNRLNRVPNLADILAEFAA